MFDRVAVIESESARVADLVAAIPPSTPVPSCPDWAVRDLVAHLGFVQRIWAEHLRIADVDRRYDGERWEPDDDDLAGWLRASTGSLVDALREKGDESPCWTWWESPKTSGAVARHQVQEVAVHRWDTEAAALGADHARPLDPEVAQDGVDEFLTMMLEPEDTDFGGTITLRATDTDDEWTVGGDPERAATVSGPASELVLLLYRRRGPDQGGLSVAGDTGLPARFLEGLDLT